MASASLDRLLHRCTVLNIRRESYRLKDRKQAGLNEILPVQGNLRRTSTKEDNHHPQANAK